MFGELKIKTLATVGMSILLSQGAFSQRTPTDGNDLPAIRTLPSIRSQAVRDTAPALGARGAFGEEEGSTTIKSCVKPSGKFLFNVENGQLKDMVSQISQLTCKNFILASNVTGSAQITVMSRSPIDTDEAWKVFLSALAVNGLALVQSGSYYKIIKQLDSSKSPTPVYEREDAFPNDEGMITMLYDVRSIPAQSALTFIRAFSSDRSATLVGDGHILFSDSALNVRRILKILEKADVAGGSNQLYFLDLNYAKASDIEGKLEEVFGGAGKSNSTYPRPSTPYRRPGTTQQAQSDTGSYQKIISDDRTNRLIIIASDKSYAKIKEIVEELDIDRTNSSSQSQIYVYKLKNADPEKISKTLTELIQGAQSKTQNPQNIRVPNFAPPSENVLFEGEIKISADKPSNSLAIVATPRDFKSVSRVIDKLDSERVQVYIEAVIMDIDIQDKTDLGLNIFAGIKVPIPGLAAGGLGLLGNPGGVGLAKDVVASVLPGILANNALAGAAAIPNFLGTFGLMGLGTIPLPGGGNVAIPSVGFLLKAVQTSSNIDILSTPSIMALDNVEAFLQVGRKIPQVTGASTAVSPSGTSGSGFVSSPTVTYQDAYLKFKITPHVNEDNKVTMELDQDISELGTAFKLNGIDYFPINNKTAKTTVVAKDQETVVIGGLIDELTSYSEEKTPILGDIPILGNLFKTTSKQKRKKNLVLILTPHVIRSSEDLKAILDRKMRERDDLANLYFGDKITKFNPNIDFNKKLGPLAQIVREVETQMRKYENGGNGLPGEVLIGSGRVEHRVQRKDRKIDFAMPAGQEEGAQDDIYFDPQFTAPPNIRGGFGQPNIDFQPQEDFVPPALPQPVPVEQNNNLPNNGNVQPGNGIVVPNAVPPVQ